MLYKKYMKVMNGNVSHANGFQYKIDEVNISNIWNPNADNSCDFGGFNFSREDKILRWLLRGDTIYDVYLPDDAEVVEVENENAPHGVFRTNKIIISNPRKITEDIIMNLYLKSDLPIKSYFQCLTFLSLKNYDKVCKKIINDKINDENIELAIETFDNFFTLKDEDKNDLFKEISMILLEIKNKLLINQYIDREPYIKKLTNDKVINLTGESGSGKSYFSNKWKYDDNYIIIDTDIVFSDRDNDNKESVSLREIFKDKPKDFLITNFDYCYKEILNYFKDSDKTIVIDSAQFRNIKDISILKGEIIIMRTSINKCYERCINRWESRNNNYTLEELEQFKNKKLGMYTWYKSLNKFIVDVNELNL